MKFFTITFLAGLFSLGAAAQEVQESTGGVEKSIFTIQTGTIGVWISNEARLGNQFALRTEIGLDLYTFTAENGAGREIKDNILLPNISFEPRWYYNIEKRAAKGKNIARNSADFVTISFEYLSGQLGIDEESALEKPEVLSIIPKWGMRRAIADSNFNYEIGGGIGYQAYIANAQDMEDNGALGLDVHIRFGYTF